MTDLLESYGSLGRCRSPQLFRTNEEVAALPARTAGCKRWSYPEGTVVGLYIEIFPSGARSWVFRYCHGKHKKITIGPFPEITLEEARRIAWEYRKIVVSGVDPKAEVLKKKLEILEEWSEKVHSRMVERPRNLAYPGYPRCKICDETLMDSICLEHIRDFLLFIKNTVDLEDIMSSWLAGVLSEMERHFARHAQIIRCQCIHHRGGRGQCTNWASEKIKHYDVCSKCLNSYKTGLFVRIRDARGRYVFLKKERE